MPDSSSEWDDPGDRQWFRGIRNEIVRTLAAGVAAGIITSEQSAAVLRHRFPGWEEAEARDEQTGGKA
jgi:hypothetical protein